MIPLKDNIPNERFPFVTVALVVINVIAYLFSIRSGGDFFGGPGTETVVHGAAIPYDFTHPGKYCTLHPVFDELGHQALESSCKDGPYPGQLQTWQTAFTSMFMHGGFLHIAGNMLFLAIFGPNVEDAMGHVRFVVFYLLGGLVALAAQVLVDPNSMVPTLGASGAIAAVLGGYILLYPRARILSLIFIIFFVTLIELPALLVLGIWFLEQIFFSVAGLASPTGGGSGVATFAHIGGFAFGLALIRLFILGRRRPPQALVGF
ncbi:MAG TPA: rhomboid family intramembrane serine protease [Solirubrobacteraceae bacterium]|jgi:membrane associated rhomboid family serine protease|nr:rhomboid family intramembrane serine protease [Solirubrobacteraceae bacterium]